jgi:hypothetical protein
MTPSLVLRQEGPPEPERNRQVKTENGRANLISFPHADVVSTASGLCLDLDINRLLALHHFEKVTDASAQGISNRVEGVASKAHVYRTCMLTTMRLALMNRTYASLLAQQLVKFVQVHWRMYGIMISYAAYLVGVLVREGCRSWTLFALRSRRSEK